MRDESKVERGTTLVLDTAEDENDDEYGPVRMIRNRVWKYVRRYPYGPHELYCLEEDPDEKSNRIDEGKYQDVVVQLRGELEGWFLQHVDMSRDGARQAVRGKGQIDVVGPSNGGRVAFV